MPSCKKYFLFFFLIGFFFLGAQKDREIDSLKNCLTFQKQDTNRVSTLNRLARIYEGTDPVRSFNTSAEALKLASSLNFKRGIAFALVYSADIYGFNGNIDSAEKKYLQAIKIFEDLKDLRGQAWVFQLLGINYTSFGKYEKSLQLVLKAVKINEQIGNKFGYAWALQSVAAVYGQLNKFKESNDFSWKSLAIMKEINDEDGIASCYNQMGLANDFNGNYDSALYYYSAALAIRKKTNNVIEIMNLKGNIGVIYFLQKKYSKALQYYNEEEELAVKHMQFASVAVARINKGEIYIATKNAAAAIESLKSGINLADSLGMIEYVQEGYKILSEAYVKNSDYKNAYEAHIMYGELEDSMLVATNMKQVNELSAKYETEKKDKELLLKDVAFEKEHIESEKKSWQRNLFIAGFIIMGFLAFFIFRGLRQKQKANIEITLQKEIIEEKQKEILDSIHYAKRIQTALLTSEKYIGRKLGLSSNKKI